MTLGAVVLFLRWPPVGLVALLVASLMVPSPYLPGGLNVAILLLGLLIGLWLLDMVVRQRQIRLIASGPVWPLLGLLLVASLSFTVGQLPWFAGARSAPLDTQLGGLAIFVFSACLFLLVAYQVRDLRWLQILTWSFVALATLFVLGWLVPYLGYVTSRIFQIGATSNSMFWLWLVSLAFSQALLNRRLHAIWRAALGISVMITLYVALVKMADWKSGYLPILVSMAAVVALRWRRAGLVLALIGVVPAIQLVSSAIASDEYSYSTRLDAWSIILRMVKTNPILGFGPANYYWYTPLFPIRGYAVSFNSHNQYIDIIAQTGILGLACFLWFAWEMGRLGWRLRTQVDQGFAQAYVYGVLGGLVGTLAAAMLVDWILPFAYNIGMTGYRGSMIAWIFLGGLVSIEQIMRRQRRNTPSGQDSPIR